MRNAQVRAFSRITQAVVHLGSCITKQEFRKMSNIALAIHSLASYPVGMGGYEAV